MEIDLTPYKKRRICVALSGGQDSMALLHYIWTHREACKIDICAMNCDHKIRPTSAYDSMFVKDYCKKLGVQLLPFVYDGSLGVLNESRARDWRHRCYYEALQDHDDVGWKGADCVATAHHREDNAETILFNVARGTGLRGGCGIGDCTIPVYYPNEKGREELVGDIVLIRPIINCAKIEISEYVNENDVPFVEDETNFADDYTRNKIRHNVLPALEDAVPGAISAVCRFSEISRETERYLYPIVLKLIHSTHGGYKIDETSERALFSRAVLYVMDLLRIKDYTKQHVDRLYDLQRLEKGKKFEFLGLVAYKEDGGISVCKKDTCDYEERIFLLAAREFSYCNELCVVAPREKCGEVLDDAKIKLKNFPKQVKGLRFDRDAIPYNAVIRNMREGDVFTKFGGGTKNLAEYFTDLKIPQRVRGKIPLVAVDSKILIVGGVEISDGVRVTENTKEEFGIYCCDYRNV